MHILIHGIVSIATVTASTVVDLRYGRLGIYASTSRLCMPTRKDPDAHKGTKGLIWMPTPPGLAEGQCQLGRSALTGHSGTQEHLLLQPLALVGDYFYLFLTALFHNMSLPALQLIGELQMLTAHELWNALVLYQSPPVTAPASPCRCVRHCWAVRKVASDSIRVL